MRGLNLLREYAAEILVILSDVKRPDGRGLDLLPRYKSPAPLADAVRFATAPVQPQLDDKQLHLDMQLATNLPAARADVEKPLGCSSTCWPMPSVIRRWVRPSQYGWLWLERLCR